MHGKRITLTDARTSIKAFVDYEIARPISYPEKIVVGHKFDFSLIRSFVDDVQELIDAGNPIDSIRIYYARSLRAPLTSEDFDVVLVPVEGDIDFHQVFDPPTGGTLPLLVGSSTPCPNVCNQKNVPCDELVNDA